MLEQTRACPICRGDFGELCTRPPNILLKSLVAFYFPLHCARRAALASPEQQQQQQQPARALILRANNNNHAAAAGAPSGWTDRAKRVLQQLWPLVRFAPAVLYPVFLVLLFYLVFRGKQVRRRR